jgi:hypothetical protein
LHLYDRNLFHARRFARHAVTWSLIPAQYFGHLRTAGL